MKTILLLLSLAFVSCEKDEGRCVTCQERVHLQRFGQPSLDYIESSTEYCDDSWKAIDGKKEIAQGTNQGVSYKKTTTMVCE